MAQLETPGDGDEDEEDVEPGVGDRVVNCMRGSGASVRPTRRDETKRRRSRDGRKRRRTRLLERRVLSDGLLGLEQLLAEERLTRRSDDGSRVSRHAKRLLGSTCSRREGSGGRQREGMVAARDVAVRALDLLDRLGVEVGGRGRVVDVRTREVGNRVGPEGVLTRRDAVGVSDGVE